MGVLYYRDPATGTYKPLGGGGGGSEEVWVGPDEPYQNEDLWFDTDAEGAPPYDWADADARYETKGSTATHEGKADPHTGYVQAAGDTMTGPLTLAADPAVAMHAATRQYVDYRPGIKLMFGGDAPLGAGSHRLEGLAWTSTAWDGCFRPYNNGYIRVPVAGRYLVNVRTDFRINNNFCVSGFGPYASPDAWGTTATQTGDDYSRSSFNDVMVLQPGSDYIAWMWANGSGSVHTAGLTVTWVGHA